MVCPEKVTRRKKGKKTLEWKLQTTSSPGGRGCNCKAFCVKLKRNKKLHFKIYYGVQNLSPVFFSDLHLVKTFLFLLTFLKINWTSTLHKKVCSRYILKALHWVWDLSKFDNKDTTTRLSCRFEVLVYFWASLCTISWHFYYWLWIFFVYCKYH